MENVSQCRMNQLLYTSLLVMEEILKDLLPSMTPHEIQTLYMSQYERTLFSSWPVSFFSYALQHDRATAQLLSFQRIQLWACSVWDQESNPCLLYLAQKSGWQCSGCWLSVVLQQLLEDCKWGFSYVVIEHWWQFKGMNVVLAPNLGLCNEMLLHVPIGKVIADWHLWCDMDNLIGFKLVYAILIIVLSSFLDLTL